MENETREKRYHQCYLSIIYTNNINWDNAYFNILQQNNICILVYHIDNYLT